MEVITASDGPSLRLSLQGRSCDLIFVGAAAELAELATLQPSKLVLLADPAISDASLQLVAESAFAVLERTETPPRGLAALVRSAARASPLVSGPSERALPVDFVASSPLTRAITREVLASAATPFPVLLLGEVGVGRMTLARAVVGTTFTTLARGAASGDLGLTLAGAPRALLIDAVDQLADHDQDQLAAWLAGPVGSRAKVVALGGPRLRDRKASGLRKDLSFAFARHMIDVPSLRERPDDIPVMTALFAKALCDRLGLTPKRFSPNVLRALRAEPWPGNVPELAAAVDAAVMLAESRDRIVRSDFACLRAAEHPTSEGPLRDLAELPAYASLKGDIVAATARVYIDELLVRARGNQSLASRMAGLDPANFRRLHRTVQAHVADPLSTTAMLEQVLVTLNRSRKS